MIGFRWELVREEAGRRRRGERKGGIKEREGREGEERREKVERGEEGEQRRRGGEGRSSPPSPR
jgi:hypothetical protein